MKHIRIFSVLLALILTFSSLPLSVILITQSLSAILQ